MISRCAMPPEYSSTRSSPRPSNPKRASISRARRLRSRRPKPKYAAWKVRFSSALSDRSRFGRCGTTAMRSFAATGSATTSTPSTITWPPVGRTRVVIVPIVVVLPAPLGPRSPKTSPSCTWKLTPATASCPAPA